MKMKSETVTSRASNTLGFKPQASRAKNGVALIFDLEGFSKFFNQPDVHDYVPKFLNHVLDSMSLVFFGGDFYWEDDCKNQPGLIQTPIHEKFLGDGALYIWTPQSEGESFSNYFITVLVNRLWSLQMRFQEVVKKAADDVPVYDLPQRIRFGLARGTIYELAHRGSKNKEYIGFCINLASRLQKYCPELGFIASARIGLPESLLKKWGYTKVIATQIKGFPKEIVIVDQDEFDQLDGQIKSALFQTI